MNITIEDIQNALEIEPTDKLHKYTDITITLKNGKILKIHSGKSLEKRPRDFQNVFYGYSMEYDDKPLSVKNAGILDKDESYFLQKAAFDEYEKRKITNSNPTIEEQIDNYLYYSKELEKYGISYENDLFLQFKNLLDQQAQLKYTNIEFDQKEYEIRQFLRKNYIEYPYGNEILKENTIKTSKVIFNKGYICCFYREYLWLFNVEQYPLRKFSTGNKKNIPGMVFEVFNEKYFYFSFPSLTGETYYIVFNEKETYDGTFRLKGETKMRGNLVQVGKTMLDPLTGEQFSLKDKNAMYQNNEVEYTIKEIAKSAYDKTNMVEYENPTTGKIKINIEKNSRLITYYLTPNYFLMSIFLDKPYPDRDEKYLVAINNHTGEVKEIYKSYFTGDIKIAENYIFFKKNDTFKIIDITTSEVYSYPLPHTPNNLDEDYIRYSTFSVDNYPYIWISGYLRPDHINYLIDMDTLEMEEVGRNKFIAGITSEGEIYYYNQDRN